MTELPIEEAKATGAITMAGEKYGDRVRVVAFGPAVEFCGGTHAHTTGELGMFVLLSEGSIGSGVRRIEGIVSKAAERYVEQQQDTLATLSESLSAKPDELVERVERLQSDVRDLQKAMADIKSRLASADAATYADAAETIGGARVVAAVVREANAEALRTLGNAIRSRLRSGVVALVGTDGDSASLFVSASDDAVKAGAHAGNLVKAAAPLVGGKGGGAPAQAQGGGKDPAGAEAALAAMRDLLAHASVVIALFAAAAVAAATAVPAPAPVPTPAPDVVLAKYAAALAALKEPRVFSVEYSIEQTGTRSLEQTHRIFRSGTDERDETIAVNGTRPTAPVVRIFRRRPYRYTVARARAEAGVLRFQLRRPAQNRQARRLRVRRQRRRKARRAFAFTQVTIDGVTFLPAAVSFATSQHAGRGEVTFAKSDRWWVARSAAAQANVPGGVAREHLTFSRWRFPATLPPSTFAAPRPLPTPAAGRHPAGLRARAREPADAPAA